MSRCFPFPPPGYEKKARIEDLELLKKDKHKKKRKKEKRDHKEKRESKNRDKKVREKDRVKDKARTLDEAKLVPDRNHCHNGRFLVQKDLEDKDNCGLTEKIYAEQSTGYGEGKSNYSSHLPEKSSAFEIVPGLPRRIKDGDTSRNLLGEKLSVCLPEKEDWLDIIVAKVTQNFDEGKTKDKNKESCVEINGDRGIRDESKFSRREAVQPKDGTDSVEKNADSRAEGKRWKGNVRDEKSKENQKVDKYKQEGKGRDKERDKNKRKKEKTEQKFRSLEKSKESYEGDVTSPDSIITSQLLRDSHKSVANMGSFTKRKDFEANGILHAKDHMSSDSAKFTSSSDLPRVNHKMLKSCQSSVPAASNWQVHSKPPHPDLECLSQMCLVPKMEVWTDFCDQDWLYSSSSASKLKKLKAHRFEMEMTPPPPHVWAEAMQIDSIDICALPYVVPY